MGFGHVLVEGDPARSVVSASGGNINGPQFDDLLQLHRKYGDKNEKGLGNNIRANATPLGTLVKGQAVLVGEDASGLSIQVAQDDFVSIDDDSDRDFYAFTLPAAREIFIGVEPRGPSYNFVAEGGSTTFLDAKSESDLLINLRNAAGVILLTQDATLAGVLEFLADEPLPAGDYFVEVNGKDNRAQMYALQVLWGELDVDGDGLPDADEIAGDTDGDGLDNMLDPDADGDGASDGAEVAAGRLPYDVRDFAFEFHAAGDAESWIGSNHVGAPLVAGGVLTGDPQLQRSGLFLDGDLMTGLLVRLSSSNGTAPSLFWSYDGAGGGGFSAGRRLTTGYGAARDLENVFFDLSQEPEWLGKRITALRLDPPGGVGSTFEVEWIRGTSTSRDPDGDGVSDQAEALKARDPYSASDLGFEFDSDDDYQVWIGTNNITDPTVIGGFLTGTTVTGDPFRTNTNFQFSGSEVPVLLIKITAGQPGTTELSWGITGGNNFTGTRRLGRFYNSTTGDVEVLVFDFASDPDWTGQEVRRFRVDPINQATTNFSIDWIRASDGDYDNDGLPDAFEASQGLDLLDPSDAASDLDGDGQSNLAEYIADTSVTDATDRLVFKACSRSGSQFSGTLQGKAGRQYRLLSWTGVEGAPWQVVPGVVGPLASDAVITLIDATANEEVMFYRAEVEVNLESAW